MTDLDSIPPVGVGIQYSQHISPWFPFTKQSVDLFEILLDSLMGPLDSPYVVIPGALESLASLRTKATLIAHSNYGNEFGFLPLEETTAVRRHVPIARMLESPWVADHCFYGEHSRWDVWSCPFQFSRREVERIADRARQLQKIYGIPLLHENAAYYFPFPGAEMSEAEFLAQMVELAGTYLHLDLHNVYTNSLNLSNYRWEDYLATIPVDRVVAIHLAGGSYSRGYYHDWHDARVPEPVWDMLEQILRATQVKAVILEFQGRAHHEDTRVLNREQDQDIIVADLERAKALWDCVYGPGSRRSTREA
jgi:hypothetical protein